eukprot:4594746-Pleurochrysis_carterae.AAC.2
MQATPFYLCKEAATAVSLRSVVGHFAVHASFILCASLMCSRTLPIDHISAAPFGLDRLLTRS